MTQTTHHILESIFDLLHMRAKKEREDFLSFQVDVWTNQIKETTPHLAGLLIKIIWLISACLQY